MTISLSSILLTRGSVPQALYAPAWFSSFAHIAASAPGGNAAFMSSVNCFSTVAKSPATIAVRIPRACGTTSGADRCGGIGGCIIVARIKDMTSDIIGQS